MQVSKRARSGSDTSPEAFRILLFVKQMQCMVAAALTGMRDTQKFSLLTPVPRALLNLLP